MTLCNLLRPNCLGAPYPWARLAVRWSSYDAASLTRDSLLRELESGLGEDAEGKALQIDADAKTVTTAAGPLPISPLFDPDWMKSRRRQKKSDPGPTVGRFRRKLANNPYARALETPIRRCPRTAVSLPRYFLQDFELVKHPESGAAWWAPGPLAFDFVDGKVSRLGKKPAEDASSSVGRGQEGDGQEVQRPRRGPITSYLLCHKSAVDSLGGANSKNVAILLAMRNGLAVPREARRSVWREDMGQLLLQLLRRKAVDGLIARGKRENEVGDRFVQPCASWDEVKDVTLRGCVLWLPGRDEVSTDHTTLDIEGVAYGKKMAVHNLVWLLGDDEVTRLKREAPVFGEHELLVLQQRPDLGVMRLHLLLWRLQGYLGPPLR